MKNPSKILSLLLAALMLVSLFPAAALAEEEIAQAEPVILSESETAPEEAAPEEPAPVAANDTQEESGEEAEPAPVILSESEEAPGEEAATAEPGEPSPADQHDTEEAAEPGDSSPAAQNDTEEAASGDGAVLTAEPPEEAPALEPMLAASGQCGDNVTWTFDGDTLTISGTGDMWAFTSTSHPGWYEEHRTEIKKVVIGSGVTNVGAYVFHYTTNLASVTLPSSVTSIGAYAFSNCYPLANVSFPAGLKSIGNYAFYSCYTMTALALPEGLTSLGAYAFYYCRALKSVTLPSSLQALGSSAFGHCEALTDVALPEGLTMIQAYAFNACTALAAVTLPASLANIGKQAFLDCTALTSITFTGTAPTIGENAFSGVTATAWYPSGDSSWTSAVMQQYGGTITWQKLPGNDCGDNLTWSLSGGTLTISGTGDMWEYTSTEHPGWFDRAGEVRSVVLGDGVTSIGNHAFGSTDYADRYTVLSKVTLPAGLTRIGENAFYWCRALKTINLPDSLSAIGQYAFYGTALESVTVPGGVKILRDGVFSNCFQLTEVTLSEGVTSIGSWTFSLGQMTSITLPESLTSIASYAFYKSKLTSVCFPASVASLGNQAFADNASLTEIRFLGPVPAISDYCFASVTATAYYPGGTSWTSSVMQNYGGTLTWRCFRCGDTLSWTLDDAGTLTISGAGPMWAYEFSGFGNKPGWYGSRESILRVVVEDGATSIGAYAFQYLTKMKSASLPDSVTFLAEYAFYDCESLTDVAIPQHVTSLGRSVFTGCEALTSMVIPDSLTSVANSMFAGCVKLESVVFPAGLKKIESSAFYNCPSLTSLVLPEGVTDIENDAFSNCKGLTGITLPAGLKTIGGHAFYRCSSLRDITIPKQVTSIGKYAFERSALTEIRFKGKAPSFGENVFQDITATAYYPLEDATWTASVMQDYGGHITWIAAMGELEINVSELAVAVGKTAALSVKNAGGQPLVWSSADPQIATVDSRGRVKGVKVGTTTILVRRQDGSASGACPVQVQFTDVTNPASFYYSAVYWAFENGITTGTSPATFVPNGNCLREQIVTFLWRLMGCPTPGAHENSFRDVKPGSYYYDAVYWALEKGITTGLSPTTFGVGKPCTREMCVTFLWRAAGCPAPHTTAGFTDLVPGAYYVDAVSWALENGVTTGVSPTIFGVRGTCTRGMIVTFLYRFAKLS